MPRAISPKKLNEYITKLLDSLIRTYGDGITLMYNSYNPPNSMYKINNDLFDVLLSVSPVACKLYMRMVSDLKRSSDTVLAVTVVSKPELYTSITKDRSYYYKAVKELVVLDLLIKTPKRGVYIINPKWANKLPNPKLVIPLD